jgi:hypothetical protein
MMQAEYLGLGTFSQPETTDFANASFALGTAISATIMLPPMQRTFRQSTGTGGGGGGGGSALPEASTTGRIGFAETAAGNCSGCTEYTRIAEACSAAARNARAAASCFACDGGADPSVAAIGAAPGAASAMAASINRTRIVEPE